ncbi:PREDICTED: ultraviolet-B receptor UVR8 [Dufourea novaeangliae]|uniref:E3 ubiquitin-protein ligase HERC2 n=1 Tax=Dufourea novaeangliae TaxID=178035 RepID=A0A154PSS9_DUFNO|nr:PREDICTED: ultraviolet-B receptor UVR8 [Dufourea novaeangliae]KZC14969.1 E3 ubiquitin-protein ligase HERC2 [Dufourea novaeangliae]
MLLYYAGFNTSTLFSSNEDVFAVDTFTEIPFAGITDFQIGWSYFLLWKGRELYICKKVGDSSTRKDSNIQLIQIPANPLDSCKIAAIGTESIVILSSSNELWRYKIYENSWKKVINFLPSNDDSASEYPVKILQGGCTVVLTNLGRVFNVPTLVEMPKRIKFVDIACGFDHTILLAENGDVYSMGMGTRGQLGHNDLEDCDSPKLVEALAGLKVVQISAMGWHSAVVTDQGDLYTWGWNTYGELGLSGMDSKVVAVPSLVDFTDDRNESLEILVKKVECGNTFTVCVMDDCTFWGCGCNKYGQLGQSREALPSSPKFVKLQIPISTSSIKDFSCREWGTVLVTY